MVRTDRQELRRRKRGRKRTGDHFVVDRLRGQLDRRTDWLRRERKWTGGQEMRLDSRRTMVGASIHYLLSLKIGWFYLYKLVIVINKLNIGYNC